MNKSQELLDAYEALAHEIQEKGKRAAELVLANIELNFQNEEKEKRAAELLIANKELAYQVAEKGKRAAELVIANLELVFQNKEKEKRAAELVIANSELEHFAYRASHDLQEPLRTIANYMWLFEQEYIDLLDEDARGMLSSVTTTTERMSALIKSLLDFSQSGVNKKLVTVDIGELIKEVISDLGIVISDSHAVIDVAPMPVINVYEIEMRLVFQNILTNGIKYQTKDVPPKIRISAEQIDGRWKFAISDNGIGIPAEHHNKVFEIFHRLHTADEYKGSGIGLANCKKIIEQHEGKIWLESAPGRGTTFFFTVPIIAG